MARQGCVADVVIAQKNTHAVDADDAAGCGTGLDLIIGYIALVVPDRARVGVREYHRFARLLHDFHGRGISRMRAIYNHADTIHFTHHLPAKRSQSGVAVMTAPGRGII